MTKEQIKNMPHLAINEEVEGLFYHVHVEDGYMLTSWDVVEDIKDYQGFECLYMPLAEPFVDFRVITKEEHDRLEAAAEEARRKCDVQAEQEATEA